MKKQPVVLASAITLGSAAAALGALAVANGRRTHDLPEPVLRRLSSVGRTEVSKGVHLQPLFGRIGQPMVIASMTSAATTREELMDQLRTVDAELVKGCDEAGVPADTSKLVVIKSELNPNLRVSTQDLLAENGDSFGGRAEVSAVDALPATSEPVVGGDAQPQDVSLPER